MRGFTYLIAVALVVACLYLAFTPVRRARLGRLREKAKWKVQHYSEHGQTIVAVALTTPHGDVLDEHVVARLRDEDPEWQQKFLLSRQEAEERAFHLNTPG